MNIHNPDAMVEEREKTHGLFSLSAPIMEDLTDIFERSPNWRRLTPMQKQVLRMFAHKAGRILTGDTNYLDHWIDIEGYVHTVVLALRGERYVPGTPEDGGHHARQQPEDVELDFEDLIRVSKEYTIPSADPDGA
jgi:hypothetical protein